MLQSFRIFLVAIFAINKIFIHTFQLNVYVLGRNWEVILKEIQPILNSFNHIVLGSVVFFLFPVAFNTCSCFFNLDRKVIEDFIMTEKIPFPYKTVRSKITNEKAKARKLREKRLMALTEHVWLLDIISGNMH